MLRKNEERVRTHYSARSIVVLSDVISSPMVFGNVTSGTLFCSRDDTSLATASIMATYTRKSLNTCILTALQTHHMVATYNAGNQVCLIYHTLEAGTSKTESGTLLLSPSLCVSFEAFLNNYKLQKQGLYTASKCTRTPIE